jgi:hypothetical protein
MRMGRQWSRALDTLPGHTLKRRGPRLFQSKSGAVNKKNSKCFKRK